jgi:hypothetical protein
LSKLLTLNRRLSIQQRFARHFPARDVDVLLGTRASDRSHQKHTRSQHTERSHQLGFRSNPLSPCSVDGGHFTSVAWLSHRMVAFHHYTWHKGMLQLR